MKKISFILLAAGLVAVSCAKENDVVTPVNNESSKIIGIIDDNALINPNEVKTTYDNSGNFSWVAGNSITVQLVGTGANAGTYNKWTYTADGAGAETTFTPSGTFSDYEIGDYAFYPKNLGSEAPFVLEYNNDNPITVTLPTYTSDYQLGSNLMQMIPLIGTKTSENTFNFSTATGVLKLNFEGVPSVGGLRVHLYHPTYPLCGKFSVSEQNTILVSNYVSGASTRELRPSGGFSTVYVAVPIGTIPSGLKITLFSTSGSYYATITTNVDIPIERNTLIELTTPIKAVTSTIWPTTVTGTAEDPQMIVTVADGESIAIAGGLTEEAALANLAGKPWFSTTGNNYMSITGETGYNNYIAYKVKKDGHVYLKVAKEGHFYYITAADKAKYMGTYGTTPSVTVITSNDCTKGNVQLSNLTVQDAVNTSSSTYVSYDADYDVYGRMYPRYQGTASSRMELEIFTPQVFANIDPVDIAVGTVDKLSLQCYNSGWADFVSGNFPDATGNLWWNGSNTLRPTNQACLDQDKNHGGLYRWISGISNLTKQVSAPAPAAGTSDYQDGGVINW